MQVIELRVHLWLLRDNILSGDGVGFAKRDHCMQQWHAYRGQEQISRERNVRQGTKSFLWVRLQKKAQPT